MKWSTGSMHCWNKMPGDEWQRFANVARVSVLSCLGTLARSCCSWAARFGQTAEWNSEAAGGMVASRFRGAPAVAGFLCAAINRLYVSEPALYEVDFHYTTGLSGLIFMTRITQIVAFIRRALRGRRTTWYSYATSLRRRSGSTVLGFPETGCVSRDLQLRRRDVWRKQSWGMAGIFYVRAHTITWEGGIGGVRLFRR